MEYFLMIFVICSLCPLAEAMDRRKNLEEIAIFRTLSASMMEKIEKKAQSYKDGDTRIIPLLLQINLLKSHCKKLKKAAESNDPDVNTKEFEQIESACDRLCKELADRLKLQNQYLE